MKNINEIQKEILEEFFQLNGDLEKTLLYIIQQGTFLPALDEKHKNENNLIKGCQSKVWIKTYVYNNYLVFHGDSNTAITKGLLGLLFRIFNSHTVEEVCDANLCLINSSKLGRFVGTHRSNGLSAMTKYMQGKARVVRSENVKDILDWELLPQVP